MPLVRAGELRVPSPKSVQRSICTRDIWLLLPRQMKIWIGGKRGEGGTGAWRSETILGLGCWLDHSSKVLHAFEAFGLALAAEIKDEFIDPEATVRSNICDDLFCSTREGPTREVGLTLCGQRDIVEWGFIGDRE